MKEKTGGPTPEGGMRVEGEVLSRDGKKHLDRTTLEAFYVRGESLSQMSAAFDAPIGTIKRRLHVARKRLARQLETAAAV